MSLSELPDPEFVKRFERTLDALKSGAGVQIDPNSAIADQIAASRAEVRKMYEETLPEILDEFDVVSSEWREQASPEIVAHLLASVTAEDILYCTHAGSPRPLFAFLTARMVVCQRCTSMVPREPAGLYDDSCDYCRRTGLKFFTPHMTMLGSMTVVGEACDDCTEVMRLS